MRDKHYPKRQFRLDDNVYKSLLLLKEVEGKSWNLVFKDLLYGQRSLQIKNHRTHAKTSRVTRTASKQKES